MIRLKKYPVSLLLLLAVTGTIVSAQSPANAPASDTAASIILEDSQITLQVSGRIQSFIDELEDIASSMQGAPADVYPDISRRYNSAKLRWNTYSQSYQGFIADHEELMQEVVDYGLVDEALVASMGEMKAKLDARTEFENSARYINAQDSLYLKMLNQSKTLSLTRRTQGELEKLKGREQLVFAEIQEKYDKASAAVELVPSLKPQLDKLDDRYIALKSSSARIQEATYKPFILKIKDYLLGTAAVAVVLMFVSMVQSKVKSAKLFRGKMMGGLRKKDDDLPCI